VSPTHQDISNDTTFSQIKSRVPVPLTFQHRILLICFQHLSKIFFTKRSKFKFFSSTIFRFYAFKILTRQGGEKRPSTSVCPWWPELEFSWIFVAKNCPATVFISTIEGCRSNIFEFYGEIFKNARTNFFVQPIKQSSHKECRRNRKIRTKL